MTTLRFSNLQHLLAVGASMGAALAVHGGLPLTYGVFFRTAACMVTAATIASVVAWMGNRFAEV